MSSSSAALAIPDHLHHNLPLSDLPAPASPNDHLCYVHCTFCDIGLAVWVPGKSFFRPVAVRCGHCSSLLYVTTSPILATTNQLHYSHPVFSPQAQNLLEELSRNTPTNLLLNHEPYDHESGGSLIMPHVRGRGVDYDHQLPKPPVANRPPEKKQRVPSAYNRFIKDEIQRIKAGNPDISHREAFSAAAKNWAHFPHIHFGLMPDLPVKKSNVCIQEVEDVLMKDGSLAPANIGISPY